MRFFFDNCMSPKLARAISALDEADVIALKDRFDPDTPDEEWIQRLGAEGGWIVVTCDTNITRRRVQRKVWDDSRLVGFYFAKSFPTLSAWEQAWRVVKWWPDIQKQSRMAAPGATFLVGPNPNGKFQTL